MITISCPSCSARIAAEAETGSLRCPQCGQETSVPVQVVDEPVWAEPIDEVPLTRPLDALPVTPSRTRPPESRGAPGWVWAVAFLFCVGFFVAIGLILQTGWSRSGPGTKGNNPHLVRLEGNYELNIPVDWKLSDVDDEDKDMYQVSLTKGANTILVSALEASSTVEEVVAEFRAAAKFIGQPPGTESKLRERQVAGERAVVLESEGEWTGGRGTWYRTTFTHQGMVYRIVGVRVRGASKEFEQDYDAVLNSFRFLGDRPAWLAKFRARPGRTALGGGLVSFEVNRSRWTETTFDHVHDYQALDQAEFRLNGESAWLRVAVRDARGDAESELQRAGDTVARKLTGARITRAPSAATPRGQTPCLQITGTNQSFKYAELVTVFVEDGLTVEVVLECTENRLETCKTDWKSFLASFRLLPRNAPGTSLAYAATKRTPSLPKDPRLSVYLDSASSLSADDLLQVLAVSPDGLSALIRNGQQVDILHIPTNRRTPLNLPRAWFQRAAFARDGKLIAVIIENGIHILNIDGTEVKKLDIPAVDVAFGPERDSLFVASKPERPVLPGEVQTSRLELVIFTTGVRRTILEFPLSRVDHIAVSPSGKRMALMTNRDYPRTAPTGGHVYTCSLDGQGLQQLTKDAEEIGEISWSADDRHIYAVRRLAVGDKGAVGMGGRRDLYRMSTDGDNVVNLTKSGRIGRAWCRGAEILFQIEAYDLDPSQRGWFRIGADDLQKRTATKPDFPIESRVEEAQAIRKAIDVVLAGKSIREVVPDEEFMGKLARAFANTMNKRGLYLDYSHYSLNALREWTISLDPESAIDRHLLLGAGAYYGETLREKNAAHWRIQPVPFGEWMPGKAPPTNPLCQIVLPFSAVSQSILGTESETIVNYDNPHRQHEGLVLAYPPSYAAEALKQATSVDYAKAMDLADKGDTAASLELLGNELTKRPKNQALARQVIALCEGAGLKKETDDLVKKAVEAGNEVPDLLIRFGDTLMDPNRGLTRRIGPLAEHDRDRAMEYYRKAAAGPWPQAEALIKLGNAYRDAKNVPLAESCWRRAYWTANEQQRNFIRASMGMGEED